MDERRQERGGVFTHYHLTNLPGNECEDWLSKNCNETAASYAVHELGYDVACDGNAMSFSFGMVIVPVRKHTQDLIGYTYKGRRSYIESSGQRETKFVAYNTVR